MCVCGDGEFIIYTALAWRNKSYGSALEFVWTDSGDYATRESGSKIKTFKNFKEKNSFTPPFNTEGLYGGPSAFFFQYLGACRRRTPGTRVDLKVPEDTSR